MARALFDINISSIMGADSNISVGAKLYFFASDGVTPAISFTTASGITQNPNPMLTMAYGRFAQQAWLEPGSYVYVLTAPIGSPASPLFTGVFVIPNYPEIFDPDLFGFIAGNEPLAIESGGTGAKSAVNAINSLGGLPVTGGNVTGNIVRQGKGVHAYWGNATMVNGSMFLTPAANADPTSQPGEIWFRY